MRLPALSPGGDRGDEVAPRAGRAPRAWRRSLPLMYGSMRFTRRADLQAVARALDLVHVRQLADRRLDQGEGLVRREGDLDLAAVAVAERGGVRRGRR